MLFRKGLSRFYCLEGGGQSAARMNSLGNGVAGRSGTRVSGRELGMDLDPGL